MIIDDRPYYGPTHVFGRLVNCSRCGTRIDLIEIGCRHDPDAYVGGCCLVPVAARHTIGDTPPPLPPPRPPAPAPPRHLRAVA